MLDSKDYLKHNKALWDKWTEGHVESDFYDVPSFLEGRNSLTSIETDLLGDINGQTVLHLQCHFGQDTISMSRMGAKATGLDLSSNAIRAAKKLAQDAGTDTHFVESDVYSAPDVLDQQFDVVFTSFGTIGWLPDLDKWAAVVKRFIKPGGRFVMAEFHPVVWMFDNDVKEVIYPYFNKQVIVEEEEGSYADGVGESLRSITWNHPISEVLNALLSQGMTLRVFQEFDYTPHNCFRNTIEFEPGKFRIQHFDDKLPLVYAFEMHA